MCIFRFFWGYNLYSIYQFTGNVYSKDVTLSSLPDKLWGHIQYSIRCCYCSE